MNQQQNTPQCGPTGHPRHYPGLEQLICVALADANLAAQLVANPTTTLEQTALVELSPIERDLAASITDAVDIYDFAARLHARTQQEDVCPA